MVMLIIIIIILIITVRMRNFNIEHIHLRHWRIIEYKTPGTVIWACTLELSSQFGAVQKLNFLVFETPLVSLLILFRRSKITTVR